MKFVTVRTIAHGNGGSSCYLMLNKRLRRECRAKCGDFVQLTTKDGRTGYAVVMKQFKVLLKYDAVPSGALIQAMSLKDREVVNVQVLSTAKMAQKAVLN